MEYGTFKPWYNQFHAETRQLFVIHARQETHRCYRLLLTHFEQIYDNCFERDYVFNRPVISNVVRGYLKCGIDRV